MREAVSSTGDDRVVNNTMRHQYRVLSEEEKLLVESIKDLGLQFEALCGEASLRRSHSDQPGDIHREMALARTKIEEAVMWAVRGITK